MRFLLGVMCVIVVSGCSRSAADYQVATGEVWNTRYKVVYCSDIDLSDSILLEFARIDRSVSVFNDTSVVSRVNRNDTVEVDSVFSRVFSISRYVFMMSGGAFDPTVSPLIELYGFGRSSRDYRPSRAEIDSVLQYIGLNDCYISGGRVYKKSPQTEFNFSAIAKGFGVDLVAEMLRRNGVRNYLIEVGGDIAAGGQNQNGEPWSIMLEPTGQVLKLTDGAVATSGNYRKHHGNLGHIIDPRTGRCSETETQSVSVVATTCALADAFATACIIADLDSIENIKIFREK